MKAGRTDGEMDVSGPHVADFGALHQLADGPVHRDGIVDRRDGADGVAAVALRAVEPAHPWAADVALVLVKPISVGLPEIEHGARYRLAVEVLDRAGHEAGHPRRPLRHVTAVRDWRRVGHVERPFDRAWGCSARTAMIDRID